MERFKLKKTRKKYISRPKAILIKILLIFIIIILFFQYVSEKLEETVLILCKAKVESIAITISNKAIDDVVEGKKYEDFITFVKDDNGKIIALKSNVVEMNNFASEIALKVQEMYDELDDIYIYVPIVNFIGNHFLAGYGPNVKVKVIPQGIVSTDFKTEFISTGINQTRHRVYLNVLCTMFITAPLIGEKMIVDTGVTVAETVLIGDVPDFYGN